MDIGPCRDEIKRSNIVICFSLGGFSSWGPPKEWISLLKMTDCLLFRKTMGKNPFPASGNDYYCRSRSSRPSRPPDLLTDGWCVAELPEMGQHLLSRG